MIRLLFTTVIVAALVGMTACSSSKMASGENGTDVVSDVDAGTDVVPDPGPETKTAATEPVAAPAPEAQAQAAPPAAADTAPAPVVAAVEPQPAPATPAAGGTNDYTVQEGDTLMKIAFETYGDLYQWKRIYEANKDRISNPNAVPKGTVLKLEKPATAVAVEKNGEKYLIKLGDTLGKISDDVYGSSQKWKKIWENNKQMIKDPNKIFAGFYLYYTMTPEERQEVDQLKQSRQAPAPLAGTAPATPDAAPAAVRVPASDAAPVVTPPAGQ